MELLVGSPAGVAGTCTAMSFTHPAYGAHQRPTFRLLEAARAIQMHMVLAACDAMVPRLDRWIRSTSMAMGGTAHAAAGAFLPGPIDPRQLATHLMELLS